MPPSMLPPFIGQSHLARWRGRLQQLGLTGRVEMFASIQEYCTHETPFENLTKLSLELHRAIDNERESSLTLEPFLRSLAPTLQSLQIINRSSTLDLSPLFSAFSQHDSPVLFRNLKSFSLHIFPNSSRPFSFGSFWDFLHNSHIGSIDNVPFPSLQSLDVCPLDTPAGRSAVLALIKHTAPTLSSLKLSALCLPRHIAEQMINPFTEHKVQQLKSLSLNFTELSVSFLNLLARSLPQLEELTLWASKIRGSRKNSFYKQLERRRYRPGASTQDALHNWKLCSLKIYVFKGSREEVLDVRALQAVAGAVPALAHRMEQHMGEDEDEDDEET